MKQTNYILIHSSENQNQNSRVVSNAIIKRFPSKIARSSKCVTIALWDLGAWIGGLNALITKMNLIQKSFIFFEAKAAVPAGLISRPQRVIPWLAKGLRRSLKPKERREIQNNLIANDFFEIAEPIRESLKVDFILGITPSMIAGKDEKFYYNHFSTFDQRTILASSYQLRDYAKQTGRPFEAFVCCVIITQVLVAVFYPYVGFHKDNNCLFDYDAKRTRIKTKVKDPKIEESCMKRIRRPYRKATKAFLSFIRDF